MDSLIYPMILLAAAIAAASWWKLRHKTRVVAGKALDETLSGCRTMLALVGHFQQHRGMSSALLSGDKAFRARLDRKAQEVEALLPALRELARLETEMPFPCLTSNQLSLFKFHWQELREKLEGLSVEQSIAQHSFLIAELLKWLAALGESRLEPAIGDSALVRNYLCRLPALTECLGQARALGASVAARHACSAVARVRLMFLVARAEALLSQAADSYSGLPEAERATLAVQQMARVVRTQMLLSSGITVGAEEYFQIATQAIDSVFGWIERCGRSVVGSVDQRRGGGARLSIA